MALIAHYLMQTVSGLSFTGTSPNEDLSVTMTSSSRCEISSSAFQVKSPMTWSIAFYPTYSNKTFTIHSLFSLH